MATSCDPTSTSSTPAECANQCMFCTHIQPEIPHHLPLSKFGIYYNFKKYLDHTITSIQYCLVDIATLSGYVIKNMPLSPFSSLDHWSGSDTSRTINQYRIGRGCAIYASHQNCSFPSRGHGHLYDDSSTMRDSGSIKN